VESKDSSLYQSAAAQVTTENFDVQQSAVGFSQASSVVAEQSLVGVISGVEAHLQDAAVGLVVADAVVADETRTGAIVTRELHATNLKTGVLLAREVHGDVETTLDSEGALRVGLAAGAVLGMFLLVGKLLVRRKG
jgi:hypothetical protein